ncbi:hypothetical protein PPSIR1_10730 [Plesiocystis pacifica SIR-1]|uniref:Uncharacterized protein n=1 Tax=Plesiocystis pacifica SIR-1 TaxID=391625 RepID=A6G4Y0_9BACT|nr:hypothetical protein [Plesiocystis pacifica]EDM79072.1 hypothetical protein PPSIR1_10730 [Plesiocystis pacifica SIR-1]
MAFFSRWRHALAGPPATTPHSPRAFAPIVRACLLVLTTASLPFTLTACDEGGDDDLDVLDVNALDQRAACDDLTIVAARQDGSEALLIGIDDGLAAEVFAYGEQIETTYSLPDERVTLRWIAGTNVFQGQCGLDSGDSWSVDDRLDAIEGELHVRLAPHEDGTVGLVADIEQLVLAEKDDDDPAVMLMPMTLELGLD